MVRAPRFLQRQHHIHGFVMLTQPLFRRQGKVRVDQIQIEARVPAASIGSIFEFTAETYAVAPAAQRVTSHCAPTRAHSVIRSWTLNVRSWTFDRIAALALRHAYSCCFTSANRDRATSNKALACSAVMHPRAAKGQSGNSERVIVAITGE